MEMELPQWLWLSLTFLLIFLLQDLARNRYFLPGNGKLPPGPTPLPFFGNLFVLGRHHHRSLGRLAKIHGPLMSLRLGCVTTVVASSPAAAKEVLQTHDKQLSARWVPDAVRVLGYHKASLIWMDPSGEKWRGLRNIWRSRITTTKRLDDRTEMRERKVRDLIEYVRNREGQPVEINRVTFATVLNQMTSTVFSTDMVNFGGSNSGDDFKTLTWEIMQEIGSVNLSDYLPFLRFFDLQGIRRRVKAHFKRMFDIFDVILDLRLEAMAGKDPNSIAVKDLLDEMLQLHSLENEPKIDRHTIKSFLADNFLAGTDTTSNTAEWVMAELLQNPGTVAKIRAELAEVVGPDREVEESDLTSLPFLQAVVKETMRLHPPEPFLLPHRAEETIEIGGLTVPVGSRVIINVWAIGRDESAWEDPDSFKPERFMGSSVGWKGQHFEMVPYGSGRRVCPGIPLVFRMLHLILAALLHKFEWSLPDGMKPEELDVSEKFGITLPMAVSLRAVPRWIGSD